jgi:hypothetical protein
MFELRQHTADLNVMQDARYALRMLRWQRILGADRGKSAFGSLSALRRRRFSVSETRSACSD